MCGASKEQKEISAEQTKFYKQLTDMTSQRFSGQNSIIKQLTDAYTPILNAGIHQEGFAGAEKAALNTQATEGVAGNYAQASKAISERQAAEGGGDSMLPSGAAEEEKQNIANAAEGQRSAEQQQITEANYATGRQNYLEAGKALGGVGVMEDPTGFAGAANTGGKAAADTADQIAKENSAWMGPVFGALGGAAGAVTSHFLPSGGSH
jgi:hypothetical protein